MKLKLAVFDLDGTLLNTLTDLFSAVNAALVACGLPVREYDEIRRFIGDGAHKLIERAVPQATWDSKIEEVYRTFLRHYAVIKTTTTKPYDGVLDVLLHLKQNGVVVAVLSNKYDEAVKALVAEMLPMVDFSLGECVLAPRKPDPQGLLFLQKKFGATPKETVLIGDSETDFLTAQNAGIPFVGVSWGARTKEELSHFDIQLLVNSSNELISYFDQVWDTK